MPRTTQMIASGKIEIKEIEFLSLDSGEDIVEVQHAGVCGTDLALFHGDCSVHLSHVCGHEFTGRVKSVGYGIDKKWVGKTVTAEINNTCLTYDKNTLCSSCKKGIPSHSQTRTVTGIINHDGAFAYEVKVPPRSMENRNEFGFTILKF